MAGLRNKDKGFWRRLVDWDVMVLSETWIDRKGWKRMKSSLLRGFKWGVQVARWRSKKGSVRGE